MNLRVELKIKGLKIERFFFQKINPKGKAQGIKNQHLITAKGKG